jgi:hypothetical protein
MLRKPKKITLIFFLDRMALATLKRNVKTKVAILQEVVLKVMEFAVPVSI